LTHVVDGDTVTIFVPENLDDVRGFSNWMAARARAPLALDTETTGLGIFGKGFNIRLVQIGDAREAWVLQFARFSDLIVEAMLNHPKWVLHNAAYDLQVLNRVARIPIEEMVPKVMDTIILSKLIEPHRRGGHKLKPLSEQYV